MPQKNKGADGYKLLSESVASGKISIYAPDGSRLRSSGIGMGFTDFFFGVGTSSIQSTVEVTAGGSRGTVLVLPTGRARTVPLLPTPSYSVISPAWVGNFFTSHSNTFS